jgi:hypothetical protein
MNLLKLHAMSDEERQLIPIYLEKWRNIFSQTGLINRHRASDLVSAMYRIANLEEPRFIFYNSPIEALIELVNNWDTITPEADFILWYPTWDPLFDEIMEQLEEDFSNQLGEELWVNLDNIISRSFGLLLNQEIRSLMGHSLSFHPDFWKYQACLYDFCISVLGLECNLEYWEIFQSLVIETGWIYPFPKVCLICERPIKLCLDTDNQLHADNETALEFADDFSIYAHHGVRVSV